MSKKVLIVSEDTLTAKLLTQVLTVEGYKTKHMARPKIFINDIMNICTEKEESDIIIFDIPLATGYLSLCQSFHKQSGQKEHLLITLSTGRSECDDCSLCNKSNSDCFLKPFRIADIVKGINNHSA